MSVSGLEPWQLAHATGLVVVHNAWPFKDEIPRGPGTGVGGVVGVVVVVGGVVGVVGVVVVVGGVVGVVGAATMVDR
jgi:hypothetical protein